MTSDSPMRGCNGMKTDDQKSTRIRVWNRVLKCGVLGVACLVVLAMILLLANIVFRRRCDDARKIILARDQCKTMSVALNMFRTDCGRYPSNDEGFLVLYRDHGISGWRGPYLVLVHLHEDKEPIDPWEQPLVYAIEDRQVFVKSKGPDMKEGTIDDVGETVWSNNSSCTVK